MPASDRVALVTGGSGGIGRGIAARLAAEGATVAVAARRAEGCQETVRQIEAAGGRAEFTVLDVTGAEAVEGWVRDAAERFGRIDWLVNNAGMNGPSARLEDQSAAEFEEVVATNLLSTFYAVHAAIPIMRAQGGGAIVNIGSTASLQGYGLLSGYTASKHAVLGLTRSIALENADIPIRANCVCPGPVDTPLMRSIEVLGTRTTRRPRASCSRRPRRSSATAPSRRSPRSCISSSATPRRTSPAPRCRSTAA